MRNFAYVLITALFVCSNLLADELVYFTLGGERRALRSSPSMAEALAEVDAIRNGMDGVHVHVREEITPWTTGTREFEQEFGSLPNWYRKIASDAGLSSFKESDIDPAFLSRVIERLRTDEKRIAGEFERMQSLQNRTRNEDPNVSRRALRVTEAKRQKLNAIRSQISHTEALRTMLSEFPDDLKNFQLRLAESLGREFSQNPALEVTSSGIRGVKQNFNSNPQFAEKFQKGMLNAENELGVSSPTAAQLFVAAGKALPPEKRVTPNSNARFSRYNRWSSHFSDEIDELQKSYGISNTSALTTFQDSTPISIVRSHCAETYYRLSPAPRRR